MRRWRSLPTFYSRGGTRDKIFDLLPTHRLQAASVEFQQLSSVVFGLGGGAGALEADSSPSGLAVTGGHGDEFHEVERDVFVATGAERKTSDRKSTRLNS